MGEPKSFPASLFKGRFVLIKFGRPERNLRTLPKVGGLWPTHGYPSSSVITNLAAS